MCIFSYMFEDPVILGRIWRLKSRYRSSTENMKDKWQILICFQKTEANYRWDLHTQFLLFSFKSWNDRQKPSFLQQTTICFSSAHFYPTEIMWVHYLYIFCIKMSVFRMFLYQRVRKSFNNTAESFPFKFSLHLGKLLSERALTFWDKNKPIVL